MGVDAESTFQLFMSGTDLGCGAGAGAEATERVCSELEPEPEQKKRGGSGSEKGYNCGKITEC